MSVTTGQKVTIIEPLRDIKYIKTDYLQKKVSDYQECKIYYDKRKVVGLEKFGKVSPQ